MNPLVNTEAAPVSQSERIILIDSLRGLALLGILMMNIPFFAIPDPASFNPFVRNEMGTINGKTWYFIEWFLEGSQRAIFSMLFGAGILLFISRLQKRTEGMAPAEFFLRRQLWLLVFGLINAFVLLWPGDILFEYAICGIIVFLFHKSSVKTLLIAAGVSLLLMTARENRDLYHAKSVIATGEVVARLDTTKVKLTDQQKDDLAAMTTFKNRHTKESRLKEMEKNQRQISGNYSSVYQNLSDLSASLEFQYGYYGLWDVLLFMFIGMAFFKSGILTGKAPTKVYWWLFIGGLGSGLIVSYFRLSPLLHYNYNRFDITKNIPMEFYEISRTLRSLGIFGLIMLMYKSGWFKWLFALARPVGQMAFTNYLMQSFMCGLFFSGIGFGWFGQLQLYQIYYVVAVVWIIEVAWSHIWLYYFRFGPLEWLWRSLTYWKIQPMKKTIDKKKLSLVTQSLAE